MESLLQKYCELIINGGISVQKGQVLVINSPVECASITRILVEEAYKSGAREVLVRWNDDIVSKTGYMYADISVFEKYPDWEKAKMTKLSLDGAAFLSISASNPEIYKGVDPAKLLAFSKASSKALKVFRDRNMSNTNQWCIVSVPTESWAKKVFPGKSAEKAIELLWERIFDASRVGAGDASANWKKHQDNLEKNVQKLNEHNFKQLHYSNSLGTDLTVGLPDNHVWCGGATLSKSGVYFSPNIPTEEVFTAPDRNSVNGVVYSSKPLVYNGNVIDEFAVWFKNGKVEKLTAKQNQSYLEKLVSSFKNADYLGEVALVPFDSPISNSKVLFYNTLYDENASCHFAFGAAYPECVKGAEGKKDKELLAMGLNCSHAHHDFMIGTNDLTIIGTKHDGTKVNVFLNGNYAL